MLELLAFTTPNSLKPIIGLEELGLSYQLTAVDLRKGEQRAEAFKARNANTKVPVLIDRDAVSGSEVVLGESAAILVYLAERSGRLLPVDPARRAKVFEQLFFHASGVSPAYLQAFLAGLGKEPDAAAKEKALREVDRVLAVLDHQLAGAAFVAAGEFTIADIAHFGWLWRTEAIGASLSAYPEVARWYASVEERPAVRAAIAKMATLAA